MILVKAYYMRGMSLTLNRLKDLLLQQLEESLNSLSPCVLEHLVLCPVNALAFILGNFCVHQVFSYLVARECREVHILQCLEIRAQLSFNKGRLAHAWNTDWHHHQNGLLLAATASYSSLRSSFVNAAQVQSLPLIAHSLLLLGDVPHLNSWCRTGRGLELGHIIDLDDLLLLGFAPIPSFRPRLLQYRTLWLTCQENLPLLLLLLLCRIYLVRLCWRLVHCHWRQSELGPESLRQEVFLQVLGVRDHLDVPLPLQRLDVLPTF